MWCYFILGCFLQLPDHHHPKVMKKMVKSTYYFIYSLVIKIWWLKQWKFNRCNHINLRTTHRLIYHLYIVNISSLSCGGAATGSLSQRLLDTSGLRCARIRARSQKPSFPSNLSAGCFGTEKWDEKPHKWRAKHKKKGFEWDWPYDWPLLMRKKRIWKPRFEDHIPRMSMSHQMKKRANRSHSKVPKVPISQLAFLRFCMCLSTCLSGFIPHIPHSPQDMHQAVDLWINSDWEPLSAT